MNIYSLGKKDTAFASGLLDDVSASFIGQPGYYTLAAVDGDNDPIGVLQAYIGKDKNYGIVCKIVYVFVVPDERENGVASEMMDELMGIFKETGINICEVAIPENDEAEVVKYVFSTYGFVFDEKDEYPYYEIPVGKFLEVPALTKGKTSDILPLKAISRREFKYLIGEIIRHDSDDVLTDEISLEPEGWEQDVSSFFVSEKGGGAFLLRKKSKDVLEPKYLSAFGRDASMEILGLMSFSAKAAGEKYSADTRFFISAKKDSVKELINKLCPGVMPKKMILGRVGS